MMKTLRISITLILAIFISTLCFASANNEIVCNKTIFAYHFNLLQVYKTFKEQLKKGFDNKNPKTLETIKEIKENLKQIQIMHSYSTLSDEEFINLIADWDTNGFFVPTGSMNVSISNDGNYYLSLDAKIDTDFIIDKMISVLPSDALKIQNTPDGSQKIEFQTSNINLTRNPNGTINLMIASESFDITPDGIYIDKISKEGKPAGKSWNGFINSINDSDCFMYAEADGKSVYNLLKSKGLLPVSNKDIADCMANITRFRFVTKRKNSLLMLAVNDEEARKKLLNLYNASSLFIQPLLETSIGKTELIDKSPWLGLKSDNQPEYISSLGFITFAKMLLQFCSGVLIDTYANSPEMHEKICNTATGQLTFAIEMYNLDHEDKITSIQNEAEAKEVIKKLQDAQYLNMVFACPTTDKYDFTSKGDLSNTGYLVCKIHESPFSKLSEEELADMKYNFAVQKKACEILICHLNIKKLYQDIEEYNQNNSDKITNIDQEQYEEVLKKLYKNKNKYPICPTTKKFSFISNGNLTEGYQIECNIHGLLEADEYEQILAEE